MDRINTDYTDVKGNRIYTGDRVKVTDGYQQNTNVGNVKIKNGQFVIVSDSGKVIDLLGARREHGGITVHQYKVRKDCKK